jgi:hypothetical protein
MESNWTRLGRKTRQSCGFRHSGSAAILACGGTFLVCGHAPLTQAIWIAVHGGVDHGNVIDIALNTIKAQNVVKSIVRPTSYVSLTNSRRNWRRMAVHLSLSAEKGTHLKPG